LLSQSRQPQAAGGSAALDPPLRGCSARKASGVLNPLLASSFGHVQAALARDPHFVGE